MPERSLLKKTLNRLIEHVDEEIIKLKDYIVAGKNVDYKVCYTRLSELQQRMQDLEEINRVCADRNRY